MLGNTTNQFSTFREKLGLTEDGKEFIVQIRTFKTTLLKLSLCYCSDTDILLKGTISVAKAAAPGADASNTNIDGLLNTRPYMSHFEDQN